MENDFLKIPKYGVYPVLPDQEKAKNIVFGDFKIEFTNYPSERHYKRTQMEYWCERISRALGLKHPVKLHIIRHMGNHTWPAERFEERGEPPVYIPATTLGQYRYPVSIWNPEYHHIIVRLRSTARENLYILAHELQHAAQCEIEYGLDGHAFIRAYKRSVAATSYKDSRFEVEARKVGVEWVERIMLTGPLEVLDECGSTLVPKNNLKLPFDRHNQLVDHFFDELVNKNQKQLEDEMKKAKEDTYRRYMVDPMPQPYRLPADQEKQYKLFMGERAKEPDYETTVDPIHFTFKWDASKVVGKDLLTKLVSDDQAKIIQDKLP